jgi:CRP-like cAMP-binding protein
LDIVQILRNSVAFGNLAEEALAVIAKQVTPVLFKDGETILQEGEPGECYFLIAKGEVVLSKGNGIAQRELGRLFTHESFGEMALISTWPRSATAKAVGDTVLYRLDRTGFEVLIDAEPRFARNILQSISGRLFSADEQAAFELAAAHQGLIISLAQLAESRDPETGGHLYRVRDYCVLLAKRLSQLPKFADTLTQDYIETLYYVSPLHDIGKVGIRDEILLKPGKLTPEEFTEMKRHSEIGSKSLKTVLMYCNNKMFQIAERIVRSHHERFDGTGYPDGLSGEAIPLEARIMSLVDVYDAIRSVRPYKEALPHDTALEILHSEVNKAFDPDIAHAMLDDPDDFARIHKQYPDEK